MSNTYTSRPSVAAAGRGRGSRTPVNPVNSRKAEGKESVNVVNHVNRNSNTRVNPAIGSRPGATAAMAGAEDQTRPGLASRDVGQRMSYEGGYTKINPNEKRRQQVSEQARKEAEQYEQYKEQNKLTSVNYVGTAGGGEVRENEARRRTALEHSHYKVQNLQKRQQWASEKQMKEDEEINKKKTTARRQAVVNEQTNRDDQRSRTAKWDEERRRVNAAFLDKIEKQTAAAAKHSEAKVQSLGTAHPDRATAPTPVRHPPLSRASIPPRSHQEEVSVSGSRQPSRASMQSSTSRLSSRSSQQPDLERRSQALVAMFPQYDQNYLMDILIQVDYSVDAAIDLLQS